MESSKKKSARVIRNFHGMPWLKKHSPTNNHAQRAIGPDGEVLSMKKTDEDYFPGTRDEKRVKKKKVKKGKTVWTLDTLEDLITPALVLADLEEEPNACSNSPQSDENSSRTTVPGATVWSKDESTADRLFPDVQSFVIDRNDEAEMLTEALVESIATLQLESFRKPTILEENQWERVHYEDEGGWEKVRRNLPSPLQQEPSSSDDGSNTSPRPGILRNKQNNFNRCFTEPESLDFGFRRLSESLKEEIKAGRSLKSVSFNETLLVKDPSGMPSKNYESDKIVDRSKGREPNIDKYGRVDGYSERRLFMGKGARMKELKYIQSKNNVAAQNNKQPESEALLVATQPLQDVLKLEERLTTAVEEPTNSVDNPEKPFTESETPTTLSENPEVENPEKPTTEIEIPRLEKTEQLTAEIEIPRLEETEQPTSGVEQQEKLDVVTTEVEKREPKEPEKAATEMEQPEPAIIPGNETLAMMGTFVTPPPVQDVREPEEEPTTAVETPRTNESEIPTSEVEVANEPTTEIEIPESEEPEKATIVENRMHRVMETEVVIPPAPMQDICQLTGMPMRKAETSENQAQPIRESDFDVRLIIKPAVQDVRYMKKDPTIAVEEPDNRRPEKSKMKMGRPEPRKFEWSTKLKTRVENQPEKSRELKDFDNNRNSIKRSNRSNIETPQKVTNMTTKHETAREEPVTRYEIVINNRRVEMVSSGTQTEGNFRDSQKENVSKTSEKKSDFVGRCLVPTLVWDDTIEKDSTLDLETLIAMDEMPKPQFQSAAWHNLLLTGALQDASYEAQNSYINNQNNFVPNSVPLNSLTIPYPYSVSMPNYSPIMLPVAPGFVKSSQLPPAFTKKGIKTDNDDVGIDSSKSNLNNVQKTKDEVHQEEDSPSRSTDDRRPKKREKNRRKSQRKRERDLCESETGSDPRYRKVKPFSQTRMEYQQRQNLWHQRKLAELRSRQNDGSLKDTAEEKSLILEENSNAHISNNNYLTESVNSPVDLQTNSPHSEMPVVYQIPNQQSPGIGRASNWQYPAYVMNPAQIPMNMISGYQCLPLIPNAHTLASGYYNPMMYQQLQSQLFNTMQAAQNSASDVSLQNGFPSINNQQQYSAAGNNDSNQIPTESVYKALKGRGRGRPT